MSRLLSLICLVAVVTIFGCKASECIDESKKNNGPCTLQYDPVCGCDGKTYSNNCAADRAGVTSYKKGECID